MSDRDRLFLKLKASGIVPSDDLLKELKISRATLSRIIKSEGAIVRLNRARATKYAALKKIESIDSRLPFFKVDEKGELKNKGSFSIFYQNCYSINDEPHFGLPPEIADMTPQGFMGRSFAQKVHRDLSLSERLSDWSNDQLIIVLARRGHDQSGNLILGTESAELFLESKNTEIKRTQYLAELKNALSGQPAGSSAGGEQPKFSVYRDGKHFIVKFAGIDSSPAQKRWRDLLISEHIALNLLKRNHFQSSESELYFKDEKVFLEIERFDRVGEKGRRSCLTLSALDQFYFGDRKSWTDTALKLKHEKLISDETKEGVLFLECFSQFIADNDRHFYNLCFLPNVFLGEDKVKNKMSYELSPAFDKLPMFYAPVSGQVMERVYKVPVPNAHQLKQWERARTCGVQFWEEVSKDKRITLEFRKIAKENYLKIR